MTTTRYEHRQTGTVVVYSLAGGVVLVAAVLVLVLASDRDEDTVPGVAIAGGVGVLLLACLVLLSSLSVAVTDEAVRVWFGPGLIRRTIPLADVRAATPVRNRWWYGWGIRLTPHGWMFNVSGLDAVEIEFTSGKRFRIGTDDPQRLAEAIRSAARSRGQPVN